jgi:hypothetical protein
VGWGPVSVSRAKGCRMSVIESTWQAENDSL